MPYLDCTACHLTVYSAAKWAHIDECPRCGAPLGRPHPIFTKLSPPSPDAGKEPQDTENPCG